VSEDKVRYCERFIELLIDLQSQLLTRRFFNTVLDDSHAIVRSRLSTLSRRPADADVTDGGCSGRLFRQLLDALSFYATFEINDETGEARTDSEMTAIHYDQITSLQVRQRRLCSIYYYYLRTMPGTEMAQVTPLRSTPASPHYLNSLVAVSKALLAVNPCSNITLQFIPGSPSYHRWNGWL